jgi:predicted PurR-regulated permease PerM
MGAVSLPFAIGFILAYSLNVPISKISERFRVPRSIVAMFTVIILVSLFCFLSIVIGPILKNCFILLIKRLPELLRVAPVFIDSILVKLHIIQPDSLSDMDIVERVLVEAASAIPGHIMNFLNTGIAIMYSAVFVIMTPIVSFYLLKDWDKVSRLFYKILEKYEEKRFVVDIVRKINKNLLAYANGQLIICIILATIYSAFLYFIGIKEFLSCGIFSGILSFAPFLGVILGFLTTIAVGIEEFNSFNQYVYVCILYTIVPLIDSNFITPKLIGDRTGIKPFWILFSICATTSILGTSGIFIAIPLAIVFCTTIKELFRYY